MKVMIVTGGADSIWTKEFIANILVPKGCEIYIQKNPMDNDKFFNYYEEVGVNFIAPYSVNKKLMKIPKIRKWYGNYKRFKALNNNLDFDYIVCIFGNPFYLKCAKKIASKNTKIITWFIGSDLFRGKKRVLKKLTKYINQLNSYTVCVTDKLNDEFKKKIDAKGADAVIDFGNSQIEEIDKVLSADENQKETFLGIEKDYLTIAIGYNGSMAQQHLRVIESIKNIPNITSQKLCLILPMTYQKNSRYMQSVRNCLEQFGVKYKILEDFLDSNGMARLWASIDIFIHAQTSDAFSASMLESLYAGCEVYNGSWLKYDELDDWGVHYNSFDNFDDLTVQLEEKINSFVSKNNVNKAQISQYLSWETCREKWEDILQ